MNVSDVAGVNVSGMTLPAIAGIQDAIIIKKFAVAIAITVYVFSK